MLAFKPMQRMYAPKCEMSGAIATLTTGPSQNSKTVFSSWKHWFVHWGFQKLMKIKSLMTSMTGKQRVSNLNEFCPSSSDPENISLPLSLFFIGNNLSWRQPAYWFQLVFYWFIDLIFTLWFTLLTTLVRLLDLWNKLVFNQFSQSVCLCQNVEWGYPPYPSLWRAK